jgi:hypothetical protein
MRSELGNHIERQFGIKRREAIDQLPVQIVGTGGERDLDLGFHRVR